VCVCIPLQPRCGDAHHTHTHASAQIPHPQVHAYECTHTLCLEHRPRTQTHRHTHTCTWIRSRKCALRRTRAHTFFPHTRTYGQGRRTWGREKEESTVNQCDGDQATYGRCQGFLCLRTRREHGVFRVLSLIVCPRQRVCGRGAWGIMEACSFPRS
jgi:hypothetical protein